MTTLEAITEIDYTHFLISKLSEELNKKESPIEIAVDIACGRDRIKKIRENLLACLKRRVEAKKVLGMDYNKDGELIKQIEGGEND